MSDENKKTDQDIKDKLNKIANTLFLHSCSFCSKTQKNVEILIVGAHGVAICDECIVLCQEIFDKHNLAIDKAIEETKG